MIEHATLPPHPGPRNGSKAARALSLLELLHPEGIAIRSLVLGSQCPPMLRPCSPMTAEEHADLIIVAPTSKECRTEGWLQEAVQLLHRRLDSNGVAYILAPLWWKSRIKKLLSHQGLFIEQQIMHLPNQQVSRYLVPINPIPAQYTCSELLPLPQWGRKLTTVGLRFFRCNTLFSKILPSVGIAVRRPGARPLFEWLFRLKPQEDPPGNVIIRMSWRGRDGAVICYRFRHHDEAPSAVAKINLASKSIGNLVREAEMLDSLGPSARSAGAQVPQKLGLEQVNEHPVLLQTMIGGRSVAALLRSQPSRMIVIIKPLISWLEFWNRSTMVTRPLSREFLNKEFHTPASLLAPVLQQGEYYLKWLIHSCLAFTDTPVNLVATHNDLTMWNILIGEEGRVGILDWETASEESLPFVDFFYAMTDAITLAHTYGDRLKAFQECFISGGNHEVMVGQFLTVLRRVIQIPDEMLGLCFHACWLHHAVNEYRSTGPSDPRPFLQLLQWLLLNRPNLCQWIHG